MYLATKVPEDKILKLIVTGGAGFIGSNLVRLLLLNGHQILIVDKLTYAGNLFSLADLERHPSYSFLHADIGDPVAIEQAFETYRPNGVIHLAAESHVDRSIDSPLQFFETNVIGTVNLLGRSLKFWRSLPESEQQDFRFLHVSTDEVFGSLADDGLFTETTAYAPRSPYSASKAGADHAARAWSETYGLPVIVTNCSNNYGPFQYPEKLVPVVILKCLNGEPIPVYGKGENVRDWLHVEDHCEALITVLQAGQPRESYNIGGNSELRNVDLVNLLCQLMDELRPRTDGRRYAEQITFVTDRPGHDFRYAIDATKIKTELGWVPKQDRWTGFRKTVQWYLDNETWWQQILMKTARTPRQGLMGAEQENSK